jgi:hypothetical protein
VVTSDNELVHNEFSELKATGADVVLRQGANHNLVVGSWSVRDLGEGNVTAGRKPIRGRLE